MPTRRTITPVAITLALLLAGCGVTPAPDSGGPVAPDSTVVVVTGPTFVGYFPPVSEAALETDVDLNTVLDDFGWHLSTATDSLQAQGYTVEVRFADTLYFRSEARRWHFIPPDSARVGYYLVAPGRAPYVVPGVQTDDELVELGAAYLRGAPERDR
ncbi:MAG TPA: hypothetical protein VFS08_08380 [Gemmatimonadaceae bacterium]|nr:hypothetical protein [Gemmatimonadaceae bacterium]